MNRKDLQRLVDALNKGDYITEYELNDNDISEVQTVYIITKSGEGLELSITD